MSKVKNKDVQAMSVIIDRENSVNIPKGLTITMAFKANSLNYGESQGNIAQIKKRTIDGKSYSYCSRYAVLHNVRHGMNDIFKANDLGEFFSPMNMGAAENSESPDTTGEGSDNENGKVASANPKNVNQYNLNASMIDFPELDLFGYLKTLKPNTIKHTPKRKSVISVSDAVSIGEYVGDMDFLSNLAATNRTFEQSNVVSAYSKVKNNLAQSEIHSDIYVYTVSIDLEEVGYQRREILFDENDAPIFATVDLSPEIRALRIDALLESIEYLYRDIRGRREDLSPILIVGGVYDKKNPFFENAISKDNHKIDVEKILEYTPSREIGETIIGIKEKGYNNLSRKDFEGSVNIPQAFSDLKQKVKEYYAKFETEWSKNNAEQDI